MQTHSRSGVTGILMGAGVASLICATPAHAVNHLWEVSELFSDSTGDVQFIEMHNAFQNEGFMAGTTLTAMNSDGTDSHVFTFPSNLPDTTNTADKFMLIATSDFEALPGSVAADYTLPPDFLFLDGGSLTFTATGGGDSVNYEALPTDGVTSLTRDLSTHDLAPTTNSPTNFAGDAGSVVVPEPASMTVCLLSAGLLLTRRGRSRQHSA